MRDVCNLIQQNKRNEVIDKILFAAQNNIPFEGYNIIIAHYLFYSANWDYINALLPEGVAWPVTSGWINSIKNNRPVNSEGNPIPWLTYSAIDYLTGIIQPEWKVFEWGTGNSTLWWSKLVSNVVGIEDNAEWFNIVNSQLPSNATIHLEEDKDRYPLAIERKDTKYDCIVIDGRQRNSCAIKAIDHLSDTGIIVFDNSDRPRYKEGDTFLKSNGFYRLDFWGLMPSYLYKSCTSIYFKDINSIAAEHPSKLNSVIGKTFDQLYT